MTTSHPTEPGIRSSVFFVPTNRDASRAIASYTRELLFAQERFGRTIPLVVSETDRGPAVAANARALAEVAERHPELPVHHLTVDAQRPYFDQLLDGEPEGVREVFRSERRDYGTAMNKLFLLTLSFGAEAFHRRDSDTRLLDEELPADAGRFPIECELAYLGRPMSQVPGASGKPAPGGAGDRPIQVVGGNYHGEWNLDVRDLAERSREFLHRLFVLLGFDPESVVEICDEAFPTEQVHRAEDQLTVVTSVHDGLNPDCGNVAVTGLHEHLPNVPGRNMLAADYFTFDKATALGIPSLHHTRAVFHEYTANRFTPEHKTRYWEGMARFADYFQAYQPMFEPAEHPGADPTPDPAPGASDGAATLVPPQARRRILSDVAALPGTDHTARRERIRAIAEEILMPLDERYAAIGRHLVTHAERYVRECDEDYRRHLLLLQRWPALVERAGNIDLGKTALRA